MAGPHPVTFDVEYPERLSRWKIFFKWIFILPQAIVLAFVGIAVFFTTFLAFFAVLFTGRYPRGFFDFSLSFFRWQANVGAYAGLLRDEYPPFTGTDGQYPHVTFSIEYPERLNQILVLVRVFTVIPAIIFLYFVQIAASVVQFIAWWAILFTGKIPRGMFGFLVGAQRLSLRVSAYFFFMTDRYPPFNLS